MRTTLGAEEKGWTGAGRLGEAKTCQTTFSFKASKQGLVSTASTKLEPAELNYLPSPLENLTIALEPLVAFTSLTSKGSLLLWTLLRPWTMWVQVFCPFMVSGKQLPTFRYSLTEELSLLGSN